MRNDVAIIIVVLLMIYGIYLFFDGNKGLAEMYRET
jgi:predicted DNA repair protein MutK